MRKMEQIVCDGTSFRTKDGRQVIFNGINVVCKNAEAGYFFSDQEKFFRAFRDKGFNLIRLGIFWDGIEPEPGRYDEAYLKKVKETVALAEKYELYVVLDMHQDLFARKYADGAPDWATLDEGAFHPKDCVMWYDAYLRSDAIIQATDRFWQNAFAPDGIGLIDHYEAMWEKIAKTMADCTNILAFEPMNEPFMGSLARNSFGEAAVRTAQQYPEFDLQNPSGATPEATQMFMNIVAERLMVFDQTVLMDFYRRMEQAVKKYSDRPLLTGGNIYSSTDVRTGISRLEGAQIYGPHGYDTVVDSDRYENFSQENVERLFAGKRESQEQLGLPVIVGEWGAFPSRDFTGMLIDHMNGILEKYLWSSTYWEYRPGIEKDPQYDALSRVYPMETAGELKSYHYDRDEGVFRMTYEATEGGVTRIYCPDPIWKVETSDQITHRTENVGERGSYLYLSAGCEGTQTVQVLLER